MGERVQNKAESVGGTGSFCKYIDICPYSWYDDSVAKILYYCKVVAYRNHREGRSIERCCSGLKTAELQLGG